MEGIRAGQEEGYNGFFWGVCITGLFHAKIADALGVLIHHWGQPNTGDRNPGSLWFHNTRLDRLLITVTSLPPSAFAVISYSSPCMHGFFTAYCWSLDPSLWMSMWRKLRRRMNSLPTLSKYTGHMHIPTPSKAFALSSL